MWASCILIAKYCYINIKCLPSLSFKGLVHEKIKGQTNTLHLPHSAWLLLHVPPWVIQSHCPRSPVHWGGWVWKKKNVIYFSPLASLRMTGQIRAVPIGQHWHVIALTKQNCSDPVHEQWVASCQSSDNDSRLPNPKWLNENLISSCELRQVRQSKVSLFGRKKFRSKIIVV